jgi:glycosyltransferase involved in cell wall biosynthesis
MDALRTASLVLEWIIALAWIGRLAEAVAGFGGVPNLWDPEFDAIPEGSPRVTVIVPARNEAANIAACIKSLLRQDYPNLRVIAVDDRSTDSTGVTLDQLGAGNQAGRLKVLHVKVLPAGWLGKTHAMALAARTAVTADATDYLLFTDADIVFAPEAVRRALVAAVRTRADHFVTLPTTISKTRGEALVLAFLQVIGMWAVRTWRVADPKAKRDAIGVGAFNMLRTGVYRQIGGFETLRMEVLEDLTLGRLVKLAGLRQRVAIAPGLVSVHWASGVLGIIRGMTKNFFAVFEYRVSLLLLATLATAVLCIGPAVLLAVPEARLPSLLAWAAAAGMYAISSRVSQLSPWYAVLMPAGAAIVVYAMLRSTLVTLFRGGVTWRGTFYSLEELRRHHLLRRARAAGSLSDSLGEPSDSIYDSLR